MIKPDKAKRLYFTVFMAVFTGVFLFISIKEFSIQNHLLDEGVRTKVRVGTDAIFNNTQYYFKTTDSTSIFIHEGPKKLFYPNEKNKEVIYNRDNPREYIFIPVRRFQPIWFGLLVGLFYGFGSIFIVWYFKKVISYFKRIFAIDKE
ncbi:MAG: hypothetical protein M0D57_01885 [Sphingobacteriales bacterium JAD_PAG50586_3]|nr:MAG: hypothetical protein M0D57_01885 [Sphingobacteriales bacterium JAD_PAG50586_3]